MSSRIAWFVPVFLLLCSCLAGTGAAEARVDGDAGTATRLTDCFRRQVPAAALVRHRVRRGETWVGLGRRYRVAPELLRALNPDDRVLRAGATVRVLDLATVPLRLEIRRGSFRLLVWRGETLLGVLPVGIGTADHPTPTGSTSVSICVRHPEWRDPVSRRVYRADDRRNVLGGYWMGFTVGDGRFRGIGIHGYTAEDASRWLGRPGSRGCIRLRQEDIAWLFPLVRPGVRALIRD